MESLDENKDVGLEKLYLITYVCTFSIIIFLRSSQLGVFTSNASDKHSIFFILYILATVFGILINILITFMNDYLNKTTMLLTLFLLLIAVLPMFFGGALMSIPYLLIFLFINNAKVSRPLKIVKCDFWMRFIVFLLIVIFYIFNLYPAVTKVNVISRDKTSGILRYSLGFGHPNNLSLLVLTILISFVIAYTDKAKKISGILSIIIIYIVTFVISDSRFFELSGLILIVGLICYSSTIIRKLVNTFTMPIMFICMIVGCIYFYLPYLGYNMINYLNILSSGRIEIGIQALNYYPIKLIGYTSTPLLDLMNLNVDDMYMGYMMKYGIIGFIILQYYFYASAYMSKKNDNYLGNLSLIVVTVAIVTINTNQIFIPILYIVSTFLRTKKE